MRLRRLLEAMLVIVLLAFLLWSLRFYHGS
jgi:hypothetical protein